MSERQKRLIEVYDYARAHFGIHTKQGFAEAVDYGRTSMSAALNGNEGYLTDSLFKNICDAFPGVFSLDYLLTGEGSLLSEHPSEEEVRGGTVSDLRVENERLKAEITMLKEGYNRLQSLCDNYAAYIDLLKQEHGFRSGGIASDDIANIMDTPKK